MKEMGKLAGKSPEELLAWAEAQPWSREMAACPQDRRWHGEGDVWTHTLSVCRELMGLAEWAGLSGEEKKVLVLAALLHDVGKPEVTAEEGEGIVSPGHGRAGARRARRVLAEAGMDYRERERVVRLVRYHAAPANLFREQGPVLNSVDLSWRVESRLLRLLVLADARGRESRDREDYIARVELWSELNSELGCFVRPFPFANNQARFLFFRGKLTRLDYAPHENYSCRVTLLSGLPGAGKDRWRESRSPELPMVSLDAIRRDMKVSPTANQGRVVQEAREMARQLLRNRTSFVFNATNIVRATRASWIRLFHDYGAEIRIVYLEPAWERILENNRRRPDPVPERVIEKLFAKLDVPDLTECHLIELL